MRVLRSAAGSRLREWNSNAHGCGPATLLTLRERQPSTMRATANVDEILTSNTISDVVPMAVTAHLEVAREAPVHINNASPILVDDAPGRSAAEATGWQVAFGGMEFAL